VGNVKRRGLCRKKENLFRKIEKTMSASKERWGRKGPNLGELKVT